MKQFYVYIHYKPLGEPFYVGKGFGMRSHNFTLRSEYHKRIVAKYGKNNIGISVFPCESEQQAFAEEVRLIAQLRLDGHKLCNLTNGGEGASGSTKSTEQRAEISKRMLGNKNCLGRKLSDEQKANTKRWNKGLRGYKTAPATEERKIKIGAAQKGDKNHNFGKTTPEEVKDKIRASNCGSKCYLAKLNEDKVMNIKIRLAAGEVGAVLAREFGVAKTQISSIKAGKTWRHVCI